MCDIFMARTVGSNKAETHDRIVRAAAKAIRRDGYAGTSVADVMKAAGLTHGGFYAHFPSREAMLAEGLDEAAAEAIESLFGSAAVTAHAAGSDRFEALVDSYLSDRHVAATDAGCTVAALGTETRRQSPEIRRVATKRIKELAAMYARESTGHPDAAEPLGGLAALVGALVIARIVDEPALSKEVRASAARLALGKSKSKKR
jgi:TetR/AcrR family transcriptional regulator, transcriptional repressor for nem operon